VIYTRRNQSLCLTILSVLLVILCLGCGSSNNSMSNNSMSQAQAQAVAQQVSAAISDALQGITPSAPATSETRPSLATAVRDIRPDASSGCNPNASGGGETCNFPIPLTDFPCSGAQGGTISVSGDIDGTLDNTGTGSVSGTFTITPAECSVSNLILNGDPSINVAGQINFTDNEIAFPVTFTETGGISYGPNPSGSCQVNATYTISASLSCTISGTVCGQTVSGNC
jgi:hypothetical protein